MLTLRNLRKKYGDLLAVDGLSLAIERGEVFGLLGPNGAGKSTTIGMSVGMIRPDAGTVTLEGFGDPTTPSVRRAVGVAPQSLALYEDLTARENLVFFGRLHSMAGRTLRRRVDQTLDMVGLASRQADRVATFSGGMKRRLNLAAAMIHEPPLLLLDEPTAGVDPQSRNSILDLVRSMAARGVTILYTTHYMEEAAKLCSRVAIVDHGRLLALGTVPDLVGMHGGTTVITVDRGDHSDRIETTDPVRDVAAIMADSSQGISGLRIDRPDLESVFLNLTGRSLRD
jgi:ABC-2 type transport system ATP-binding protein